MKRTIKIEIKTDNTGVFCHRTCDLFRLDERIIGKQTGKCAVFGHLKPKDKDADFSGMWYRSKKCQAWEEIIDNT